VTTIVVDGVVHVVEYDGDEVVGESEASADRRTQEAGVGGIAFPSRQLQLSCGKQCSFDLGVTCGGLGVVCAVPDLFPMLAMFCPSIALLCGEDAMNGAYAEKCAVREYLIVYVARNQKSNLRDLLQVAAPRME